MLVHIGEFKGLTGNKSFEELLLRQFECQERHTCLSWGTDASEVSFWVRKPASNQSERSAMLLPCSHCGKHGAVRRCRLLRYLVYCGEMCYKRDLASRNLHLGINMIDLGAKCSLDFLSDKHFSKLQ